VRRKEDDSPAMNLKLTNMAEKAGEQGSITQQHTCILFTPCCPVRKGADVENFFF
jgi:hypothetical protein